MTISASTLPRRRARPSCGGAAALEALETERQRHDGHGQRAGAAGDLGDDRRGAGPRAAAEAGGQEDHVGAFDRFGQRVATDLGGALALRRVAARAEALRAATADR